MKLIKKFSLALLMLFFSAQPVWAEKCTNPNDIPTSIGCIPTDPQRLVVNYILANAIKIAGGVAFLLFLWGGFTLLTSSGNPEKLNNGKEIIVSALSGLLFIIFSVYLLRVIGYDILQIPGFEE